MNAIRNDNRRLFSSLLLYAGGAAIIAGIFVWGFQISIWLPEGRMPEIPLLIVWVEVVGDVPEFTWKGVEKSFHWVLSQNAGLGSVIFGGALCLWGRARLHALKKEEREAARAQEWRAARAKLWDQDGH